MSPAYDAGLRGDSCISMVQIEPSRLVSVLPRTLRHTCSIEALVARHATGEPDDAVLLGDLHQLLEHRRADPVVLPVVGGGGIGLTGRI